MHQALAPVPSYSDLRTSLVIEACAQYQNQPGYSPSSDLGQQIERLLHHSRDPSFRLHLNNPVQVIPAGSRWWGDRGISVHFSKIIGELLDSSLFGYGSQTSERPSSSGPDLGNCLVSCRIAAHNAIKWGDADDAAKLGEIASEITRLARRGRLTAVLAQSVSPEELKDLEQTALRAGMYTEQSNNLSTMSFCRALSGAQHRTIPSASTNGFYTLARHVASVRIDIFETRAPDPFVALDRRG